MIRVICPTCGAKLNAKEKLIGHTRDCPNCGNPLLITAGDSPTDPGAPAPIPQPDESDQTIATPGQERLPTRRWLDRLNRHYHYLICGSSSLVAIWQHNGDGWMIKVGNSMVPAARNRGQVLSQGDFRLVELKLETADSVRSLTGIMTYRLAEHYALQALEQGDDQIVTKIVGPGQLSRDQKVLIRRVLKEQFMYEVWKDSTAVMDYLGNNDFHSPGAG